MLFRSEEKDINNTTQRKKGNKDIEIMIKQKEEERGINNTIQHKKASKDIDCITTLKKEDKKDKRISHLVHLNVIQN